MSGPIVAGEPAADRLMDTLRRDRHGRHLTRAEVAAVLHALADYTAIDTARRWQPEESPTLSICRWFHAVADQLNKETRA